MSFWELLVIVVVGLLVVGPERLPDALRSGMLWFGRLKRSINDTRSEFEQQLGMDEIRRELHNEQVMKSLKALEEAQRDLARDVDEADDALKAQIKAIEDSIDEPVPHDEPANPELSTSDTEASTSPSSVNNKPEHEPERRAD